MNAIKNTARTEFGVVEEIEGVPVAVDCELRFGVANILEALERHFPKVALVAGVLCKDCRPSRHKAVKKGHGANVLL